MTTSVHMLVHMPPMIADRNSISGKRQTLTNSFRAILSSKYNTDELICQGRTILYLTLVSSPRAT